MAKGKLLMRARKSSLMDISISYGGDRVKFNLYEELKINEKQINEEIINQPTYYAFLAVLAVKLNKRVNDLEKELNKLYSELFLEFKDELNPQTHKPHNNDTVEALINTDEEYQKMQNTYHKAIEDKQLLEVCVKAYEQRAHLLQSLNANVRKEKYTS